MIRSALKVGKTARRDRKWGAVASTVPLLSMDNGGKLGQFTNLFRVDSATFEIILNKAKPLILKQYTSMSASIPAGE